jgi:outer membrane protein assembly factor BamB
LDAGTYDADISDDLVVFPAGQTIYALDRFTGEKRWETFFEEDAFDIGISIGKGMVYVGSLQQHVYALDLQTGEVLWQTYSPGSITTILTVKDGRVYFCNEAGGQLWVLDAKTGKVIWNGFPPEYEEDQDYYYLSPLAVGEGYMVNVGSRKMYGLTVP